MGVQALWLLFGTRGVTHPRPEPRRFDHHFGLMDCAWSRIASHPSRNPPPIWNVSNSSTYGERGIHLPVIQMLPPCLSHTSKASLSPTMHYV